MHPLLFNSISAYYTMWACGIIIAIALGIHGANRAALPRYRCLVAMSLAICAIIAGSKMMYLAEAAWFPNDDYVPAGMRTPLHGFRIPGGIMLLALTLPIITCALNLSLHQFGAMFVPFVAIGLVFVRVGCFLNGCCFGRLSSVAWAVRFPKGSWVTWYQKSEGWIPLDAAVSLSVHPLQLYFVLASAGTAVLLLWQRQRGASPSVLYALFYVAFFCSTSALEPLRQNQLTLNNLLVPLAAIVSASWMISLWAGRHVQQRL